MKPSRVVSLDMDFVRKAVHAELAHRQYKSTRRHARPARTAQYMGISLATLWRWSASRENFPKPRKIGPRATVWDLNEIDAWLDAQHSK